jgi:hypothetical protein
VLFVEPIRVWKSPWEKMTQSALKLTALKTLSVQNFGLALNNPMAPRLGFRWPYSLGVMDIDRNTLEQSKD